MRIQYDNTLDDLIAFQEFHIAHSPMVQKSLALNRWASAFLVLLMLSLLGWSEQDWLLPAIGLVGAVITFFLTAQIQRRTMRSQLAKMYREGSNKGTLGPHELEIKDEGLVERSEFGEQKTTWQAVERIASTDKHTFLYVGSLMAHVIPHERVTEGDYQAFVHEAEQRRASRVVQQQSA